MSDNPYQAPTSAVSDDHVNETRMSVVGLVMRFAVIYLALLIAAGAVVTMIGAKTSTSVNFGVLMAAVLGVCNWFASKNRRSFIAGEKLRAVLGMWVVDVFFQLLFLLVFGAPLGGRMGPGVILFSLGFVSLMHAGVIYFFTGMAVKAHEKKAASPVKTEPAENTKNK